MGILNPDTGGAERPEPGDIWRTWLMTGARAHPIDRRRLQGRHRGLKQILAEGGDSDALRRPWRDFSRAMVRQSVNEAMVRLTPRERVVITMAYFAGFSNEEISEELGMTMRGVQRSLRRALDRLSDALERGKRVALGLALALTCGRFARWLSDTATPAASHAAAVAAVVAALAVAPAAGMAVGPHQPAPSAGQAVPVQPSGRVGPVTTSQTPPAAAPASAPAPAAPAPAVPRPTVAAPSLSTPDVHSAVAVPPVPKLKAPKVTVPRLI